MQQKMKFSERKLISSKRDLVAMRLSGERLLKVQWAWQIPQNSTATIPGEKRPSRFLMMQILYNNYFIKKKKIIFFIYSYLFYVVIFQHPPERPAASAMRKVEQDINTNSTDSSRGKSRRRVNFVSRAVMHPIKEPGGQG